MSDLSLSSLAKPSSFDPLRMISEINTMKSEPKLVRNNSETAFNQVKHQQISDF